ncbi:MAG: redoxin domain-containing protein [Actinomycetota bacterium]|nr:redoxin domain-containing protein [Actinomycetota bacterium]
MARTKTMPIPEVGEEAPEFNLPSAQGGQLRLSMRTARGPVVVVFFRGVWSEEDVEYFKELSAKEDEINHAGASVVGIGVLEPDEARDFVRASGIKSYVLYDYVRITGRQWGLLEKDKEHGEYARPAAFIVGTDHKIAHAWVGERPSADEILAKVSEITGLPKPPEEEKKEQDTEERQDTAERGEKPKKMSAEERERIKAARRAAREAGKSVKSPQSGGAPSEEAAEQADKPKKMSAEERERIKAERRAAREAGKSLKQPAPGTAGAATSESPAGAEKPKKMSAEERERIKAERRAAREAGKSLKKPTSGESTEAKDQDTAGSAKTTEAPEVGSEEPQESPRNKVREE